MKTCFSALILVLVSTALHAQPTAFTYQGRLNNSGEPAAGIYDLRFAIWNALTGGAAVSGVVTNAATSVSNGLFSVTLDFGAGVFTGAERWLEIGVRTNGSGAFTALSPRQRITSTPYAITAGNVTGNVSASQLTGSIAPANIAAGTITSTMLAAGSVNTSNLANGAVTLEKLNTSPVWTSSTAFTNPTPAIGDYFGSALAAVGHDRILIGAQWDSPGVFGAGAAYLFSTNGTLLTTITNPFPAQDDLFGLALGTVGGDKLIVGAYLKDVPGATNTGAAYLFNTNGTLLATFTNPTPVLDDNFGWAVAGVGADKVVIGANNESTGGASSGAAYVFSLNGTLLATIPNPTPAPGDQFGYQVAAFGSDRMLISSVLDDTGETNAGAVYLFRTNGTLLMTFTNPMPAQSLAFGLRIAAVDNDRVLISAALSDFTNGIVFLYSTNGTLLTTFGPATWIGTSLAWISPDKVAVGAQGDGAGSVRLFTTNGAPLATIANPTPDDGASFGAALAVFGDKLLVGVPLDDTGAIDAGVAQLFGIGAQYIPGLIGDASFAPGLGNLAIDSSRIVDGTIAEVDLADGAVSDVKISSVDASKLTGTILDALLSPNVAFLGANQTFTGQNTFDNPANNFTGNGAGLSGVNAVTLGGIGSGGFWRTTGNAGTTAGPNFLGTTDNQAVEIRANNTRALRIEPAGASSTLVGGFFANTANGHASAVVAGGGTSGSINEAQGNYAFVGAGHGSKAAAYSAVVAGAYNVSPGQFSFVGSGEANTNAADFSFLGGGMSNFIASGAVRAVLGGGLRNSNLAELATIAGGALNRAAGPGAFIGGGGNNRVNSFNGVVSGGANNAADANAATVAGGSENRAGGDHSTVVGGQGNDAGGVYAFIGGGNGNIASGVGAVVGGGGDISFGFFGNTAAGAHSFVGSGSGNIAAGAWAAIGGGGGNNAGERGAFVGGGEGNHASGILAVIGGGEEHRAMGNNSFIGSGAGNHTASTASGSFVGGGAGNGVSGGLSVIGGGSGNTNSGSYSVVAGGAVNTNRGDYAMIPGGSGNLAAGNYSFAAGRQAKANHHGSFVWADSTGADFSSGAPDQFLVRASFAGINRTTPVTGADVFSIRSPATDTLFGGMYVDTAGNAGLPFYGYAQAGSARAYHYLDGSDTNKWKLYNGGVRLTVATDGKVGIGTMVPQQNLSVAAGLNIDQNDVNNGGTGNGLTFGNNSGEGIASKRTAGGNRWGLDFYTGFANRMTILNNGNVGIGTTNPVSPLHVNGEARATIFTPTSDRAAKENFQPINAQEVLAKVAALSIARWNFKAFPGAEHIGPVAQDFHAAFGVGANDKTIATVDADGVALAAIQGLNQKLTEELRRRDAENAELKTRLAALEKLVSALAKPQQ